MSGAVGSIPILTKAYIASEAIGAKKFVKFGTDETDIDICDTAGERVLGIATEAADAGDVTNEKRLNVTIMGIEVVVAGGTVSAGDPVQTDASGDAVALAASTADQNVAGIAMADALDGDWLPVLLTPGGSESVA